MNSVKNLGPAQTHIPTENTEQAAKPARKPFERISDDTLVRDVKTFQNRATHLVRDFGHKTVGEMRALFGGMTVSKIGRMPAAARAATLGMWGANRALSFDANNAANASALASMLGFTAEEIQGARPETIAEFGLETLKDQTSALVQDLKVNLKDVPGTWSWSGAKNATFTINQLPYASEVSQALNIAFEADRAGAPEKAIALYDSVLALDPQNADAINRRGIALGHLASTAQADTRSGISKTGTREAKRALQSQANEAFRAVLDMGAKAGVYNPQTNTLKMPDLHSMLGSPQLEGLFTAVAKAQYNLAVGEAKADHFAGGKPHANEAVRAGIGRVGALAVDLEGGWQALKQFNSADGDYEQAYNAALTGLAQRMEKFADNLGPRLAEQLSKDGDLAALKL